MRPGPTRRKISPCRLTSHRTLSDHLAGSYGSGGLEQAQPSGEAANSLRLATPPGPTIRRSRPPASWVSDNLSDNRHAHRWTYRDVGGLFPQFTVYIGPGGGPLWIAWGSISPVARLRRRQPGRECRSGRALVVEGPSREVPDLGLLVAAQRISRTVSSVSVLLIWRTPTSPRAVL
jgi:hypothetical protein